MRAYSLGFGERGSTFTQPLRLTSGITAGVVVDVGPCEGGVWDSDANYGALLLVHGV